MLYHDILLNDMQDKWERKNQENPKLHKPHKLHKTHSLQLPDITLNTSYINSFHHPNTLATISALVDTASPSLLYRLSTCEKILLTESCTVIYIY